MERIELLSSGISKDVWSCPDPDSTILVFKDTASAFWGIKLALIAGKGELNNRISAALFTLLEKEGIRTHFIKAIDANSQFCKKVDVLPIRAIVRNVATGSIVQRIGIAKGHRFNPTVIEFNIKNSTLDDPFVTPEEIVALGICSESEIMQIRELALRVNAILTAKFAEAEIDLVDLKLEFGKDGDGETVLADELTPDTFRLWDKVTGESLDKDRFRLDMGEITWAYQQVLQRISSL